MPTPNRGPRISNGTGSKSARPSGSRDSKSRKSLKTSQSEKTIRKTGRSSKTVGSTKPVGKRNSKSTKSLNTGRSSQSDSSKSTIQKVHSRSKNANSKEMQRTQSMKSDGSKRSRPNRDQGHIAGARTARANPSKQKLEVGVSKKKVVPLDDRSGPIQRDGPRRIKKPGIFTKIKRQLIGVGGGEDIQLEGAAYQAAELLNLSQKQLQHLKVVFQDIDSDGGGRIEYDEFFSYIEENRSAFSDSLFALIDLDGSGSIDFNEFVQVLATYCMYTKDDILRFAFEIFDKDASGTIDEKEFIEMCVVINAGNPVFPGNFVKAIAEFDRNDDGLIDYEEFHELNRRYPLIIFPAFRMQDRMQKATLGERGWNKIMKRQGKQKYLEDYMASHNGALPPKSTCEKVTKLLSCRSSSDAYAA